MRFSIEGLLTAFAALAATAAANRAGAAEPPPDDAVPIAANAGATYVFRAPTSDARLAALDALSEYDDVPKQLQKMFGVDLFNPQALARLGPDDQRPVLYSWGIVDPAAFARLLAPPTPPATPPAFSVRFWLVVPVTDAARAEAELDRLAAAPGCARRRPDDEAWQAWLGRLSNAEDTRAARATDARYVCLSKGWAVAGRSNRARRELHWTVAFGTGALVADASTPPPPAAALGARLREAGLLSATAGFYTTPAEAARARAAVSFTSAIGPLMSLPAGPTRNEIWKKSVRELGAADRLVGSAPRLFSDMLVADQTWTWSLTAEGRTFFAGLKLRAGADVNLLRKAITAKLRPQGAFATPAVYAQTMGEGGTALQELARHFVWPHLLAFTGAHPREPSRVFGDFPNRSAEIDLDVERGRLRLRATGDRL